MLRAKLKMPNFKVYFFQTARGSYPVKEFIEKQNEEIYVKILRSIKLLKKEVKTALDRMKTLI